MIERRRSGGRVQRQWANIGRGRRKVIDERRRRDDAEGTEIQVSKRVVELEQ